MVEVPTPTPVTTPVPDTVATEVVLLLHVTPVVTSDTFMEKVWQKGTLPVIAAGCVFTVTIFVATQLPIVYDIVEVPTLILLAVTVPSVPTVATVVVVLLHVPPPVASVSAVVAPWHTLAMPVIATGCVFTVTTVVAKQLSTPHVIVEVPTLTPVTTPVPDTVATEVVLLLHVTPVVASVKFIEKV